MVVVDLLASFSIAVLSGMGIGSGGLFVIYLTLVSSTPQLAAQGLDGLEVAHPDHDADMRRTIARWAEEFDLVPTAGSDFHGERVIPERRLCECGMARAELEALRRRRSGAR